MHVIVGYNDILKEEESVATDRSLRQESVLPAIYEHVEAKQRPFKDPEVYVATLAKHFHLTSRWSIDVDSFLSAWKEEIVTPLYKTGIRLPPWSYRSHVIIPHGRKKDAIPIGRVQRAATKMIDGRKSVDYETRLAVLDLFPLEFRRLRGDLGLMPRLSKARLTNTWRGYGSLQLLNDKNKANPGNLSESLDPVYQSGTGLHCSFSRHTAPR
ncbi:hypothetical protein CLF_112925 [Clonorchis sinensis]|uniref:Uncharacterized protein n=1 Tax=Clonorchis sinensis TaxID=79923 RepID=G7YXA1_CLOSI|nr:hypothetical protein CLF_112925 [Clonorchis sinensis]